MKENSVKQMPSDVLWDVEYEGYNFHVRMGFDCKDVYDIDECSCDSDFDQKYPEDSKKRDKFLYEMIEFLRDKIWNDKTIWEDYKFSF